MSYEKFKKFDEQIDRLYMNKQYQEAVTLLNTAYERFPDYSNDIFFYELFCYRALGNFDKCLEMIENGNRKGLFFDIYWDCWKPIESYEGFDAVNKKNLELKAAAQKNARMTCKAILPEGYSKDKKYPLFIALHGDGNCCNIDRFQLEWKPDVILKKKMIVVYAQSSSVRCTNGFGWTRDFDLARNDIFQCYREIRGRYSIDENAVILGGFSGGAMASLNIVMHNTIPAKGIVALCPGETEDVTDAKVKKAAASGVKIVILEDERSDSTPWQKKAMEMFDHHGLPYRLILNNNIGRHGIPKDMDDMLEASLSFIMA